MPSQKRARFDQFHGSMPRGLDHVPRSPDFGGRFGRLFRNLPPFQPDDDLLALLATTMIEQAAEVDAAGARSNNDTISAGFTYFGQFVDHDLTFDPTSKLQKDNDPDALEDFRTPRFDLDSLYGRGPADEPFLYEKGGLVFLIGKDGQGKDDLPRNGASPSRALIGDPRNDENLIVSQLHLAFLKFHNRVVADLGGGGDFEQAREIVRRHYQWIVLHEFLRRIVGQDVIDDVLERDELVIAGPKGAHKAARFRANLKFYHPRVRLFMPVEFSVAAYRLGHSMVRFNYALNPATAGNDAQGNPKELQIFLVDPKNPDDPNANDLRGFRARPNDREIEWFRFFEFPEHEPKDDLQVSRGLDTQIAHGLGALPPIVAGDSRFLSLAERNLRRGKALELPAGQAVARAMGIPRELIISVDNQRFPFSIGTGFKLPDGTPDPSVPDPPAAGDATKLIDAFGRETPLWYYVLKEAELISQGKRLGPVGGRIVAEVFVGLLLGDETTFFNVEPNWRPTAGEFGCVKTGTYTFRDLLTYALRL